MKTRKYWAILTPDNYMGVMRSEAKCSDFDNAIAPPMGAYRAGIVVPIVPIIVTKESSKRILESIAANIRLVIDCGEGGKKLSDDAAKQVMKGLGIPIGGRR